MLTSDRTVVTTATLDVVLDVAGRLRDADRTELRLVTGEDPEHELCSALEHSLMCKAAFCAGRPYCIFGIIAGDGCGILWGVSTDDAKHHARDLIMLGRQWGGIVAPLFPYLYNLVWAGNTASLRYVQAIGFRLLDPVEIGPERAIFYPIRRG